MEDLKEIKRQQGQIRYILVHYNNQLLWLEEKLAVATDPTLQRQIKNIMDHYKAQVCHWTAQSALFDKKIADYYKYNRGWEEPLTKKQKDIAEKAEFDKEALEWWPFLKTIVEDVNFAAWNRDRTRLDNIFIQAINHLGMKIEQQEVKQAEILTVADLTNNLHQAIETYKYEIRDIVAKRKRLKNPIGKRGILKETTLKQYESIIKGWKERQKKHKIEIRALNTQINSLRSSTMLKFNNGLVLTVHYGGKCSAI